MQKEWVEAKLAGGPNAWAKKAKALALDLGLEQLMNAPYTKESFKERIKEAVLREASNEL